MAVKKRAKPKSKEAPREQRKARAAALLADGLLSRGEVAAQVGVQPETVSRWCQEPAFQSLLAEHTERIAARIVQHGVANRNRRIAVLEDMHSRLLSIVQARAKAWQDAPPSWRMVPQAAGLDSGLVLKQEMATGTKYVVDTETVKELRSIHERVAKELGQDAPQQAEKDAGLDTLIAQMDRMNEQLENDEEPTVN